MSDDVNTVKQTIDLLAREIKRAEELLERLRTTTDSIAGRDFPLSTEQRWSAGTDTEDASRRRVGPEDEERGQETDDQPFKRDG